MTVEACVGVVEQSTTRLLLEVTGPVDAFTRAPLAEALQRALDHREVVVDLSRVTFFSAAGLHTLVAAEQGLAARGGALRLVAVDGGPVMRVLRILDMQDRWPVRLVHRTRGAGRDEPDPG